MLSDVPEDATERDVLYGLDYVTRDRHFSSDTVRNARLRHDRDSTFLQDFSRFFCGR